MCLVPPHSNVSFQRPLDQGRGCQIVDSFKMNQAFIDWPFDQQIANAQPGHEHF